MTKTTNELLKLEKAALITTGAAAAFNVLLWSLDQSLDSQSVWVLWLRALFACVSFVALDLVIYSIVVAQRAHGRTATGMLAAIGATCLSALIALDVANVLHSPWLHAGPAVVMFLYMLHLGAPRAINTADTAVSTQQITQAVQINVASSTQTPALPATIAAFISARFAEQPKLSQAALAAELGTSVDTVRRALVKSTDVSVLELDQEK